MNYFQRLMMRANAKPAQTKSNQLAFDPFEQFELDDFDEVQAAQVQFKQNSRMKDVKPEIVNALQTKKTKKIEPLADEKPNAKVSLDVMQQDVIKPEHTDLFKIDQKQNVPSNEFETVKDDFKCIHRLHPRHEPEPLNVADQFMEHLGLNDLIPHQKHLEPLNSEYIKMDTIQGQNDFDPFMQTILPTKHMNDENQKHWGSIADGDVAKEHVDLNSPNKQLKNNESNKSKAVVERIIEKHLVINQGGKTWSDVIQNSYSTTFGAGQL